MEEKTTNNISKDEFPQRLLNIAIVISAIFGLLLISTSNMTIAFWVQKFVPTSLVTYVYFLLLILPFVALLFSGVMTVYIYLQTGFKKNNSPYLKDDECQNKITKSSEFSISGLAKLKQDIQDLILKTEQSNLINENIETKDSDELMKLLKDKLIEKSSGILSKEILNKIEDKVKTVNEIHEIENIFSKTLERLLNETKALSRRGSINLLLGIVTTIIGLFILGYFVLVVDKVPVDKIEFITYFIPRLSLVILIEVFAYFFLKLYKSSLSEIKYFQNEITNIESKHISLKCSLMISDDKTTSNVISILANTERNAILEKGQTTADIEKSKIEQQNIATISEKVSSMLGKNKNT